MRLSLISFTVVALFLQGVVSSPNYRRNDIATTTTNGGLNGNDTLVAQFLAVLENIEVAFYNCGLIQFDDAAFDNANYDPEVRRRFVEIFQHEKDHLAVLNNVLGDKAPHACNYTFPVTDVRTFVTISRSLAETSSAAFAGAMRFLQSPELILLSASILAVESNHAAWVASSASNKVPWGGSFKNPLTFQQSWNLVSNFIVPDSCPITNPNLGLNDLPPLNISGTFPGNQSVVPGSTVKILSCPKNATHIAFTTGFIGFTAPGGSTGGSGNGLFASGSSLPVPPPIFVPIKENTIVLPQTLSGQVIGIATAGTTANDPSSLDSITVAKPVIFWFEKFANNTPTN